MLLVEFGIEVFSFFSLTKNFRHRPKYRELLEHPFLKRYEMKQVDVALWYAKATSGTSNNTTLRLEIRKVNFLFNFCFRFDCNWYVFSGSRQPHCQHLLGVSLPHRRPSKVRTKVVVLVLKILPWMVISQRNIPFVPWTPNVVLMDPN